MVCLWPCFSTSHIIIYITKILDLYPEMARHLDPRDLRLIIRHYEEGYGYNELAEEYHTSQASVKMRLQRARKKLQKNLKIDVFIFFI